MSEAIDQEPPGLPEPQPAGQPGAEPPAAVPVRPPEVSPLQPAPPCWPSFKMLAMGVAMIWGIDLTFGLVYAVASIVRDGGAKRDMPPAVLVLISLLSAAGTLGVLWLIVCRLCGRRFREGFALKRVPGRVLASSIGLALIAVLGATWMQSRWPSSDTLMTRLASTPGGLAAIFTLALVLPPFEELYYRGFIFPVLRRYLGAWAAVGLVTVWFTGAHVIQLFGDPAGLAVILVMGFVWTLQRHLTDSLIPGLITHWLYNAGLLALSVLLS